MRLERSDLELEVLVRRISEGEVDLQPDFQRGEVWSIAKRRLLIDSVLRGWYIPPVHLIFDEGSGRDLVLDGQQRLTSVMEFFAGALRIDGKTEPRNSSIEQFNAMYYFDLPMEIKKSVRRFPLTVITLRDYTPSEPRELFFRLNQHVPLTPSEKRNSLYGPARDQVRLLVQELTEEGLLSRESVGFANGRLGYDDVMARFGLAVHQNNLFGPLTNARIEDLYRSGELRQTDLEAMRKACYAFLTATRDLGIRYNKATIFSWLVFTFGLHQRSLRGPSPEQILDFETARGVASRGTGHSSLNTWATTSLQSALEVYNDRSSYRVADSVSIRLRDLVLHLFHSVSSKRVTDERVKRFLSIPLSSQTLDEARLHDFMDDVAWGATL